MKRINWSVAVDVLILLAVLFVGLSDHPVHAQLAGTAGFNFTHITTATNTQIKNAGGTLHAVTTNGIGTGTLTTIVDTSAANCTGGTVIGVITMSGNISNYIYDLQFVNGLCVTTAGAPDITVTSR
jgi:hypothetical protein